MKKQTELDENEFCREIFKFIFSVVDNNNIGSIKRNKLGNVTFSSLKRARLNILKKIRGYIEKAMGDRDYYRCLYDCIRLVNNSDLQINYDMMFLAKRVLGFKNYSEDKVMDIFMKYQYFKACKELEGIYILTVHQSKGREFDYVYLIDREAVSKDENLLYVALSRVKEKLVIFDWVVKQ